MHSYRATFATFLTLGYELVFGKVRQRQYCTLIEYQA